MPIHKLSFFPNNRDLSATAKKYLDQSFVQEDYESYWLSIEGVLDDLATPHLGGGTTFAGVRLPKGFNWKKKRYTLTDIPKEWWKLMDLPPKTERAMREFWRKYPTGVVEWKW